MKRIILATAVALTLTACATNQDAYYNAISEREKRLAQQEMIADTAIADMAAKGDLQAKGMGIMYFGMKSAGAKSSQQMIAAPKTTAEQVLPWLAVLLPEVRMLFQARIGADVQMRQSDNALAGKLADNDMITDLVHGRITPIVGDADDVLLYPR
jgi:hypothetical protein